MDDNRHRENASVQNAAGTDLHSDLLHTVRSVKLSGQAEG